MDRAALRVRACEAGETAQWHWYADDRSDDPVDPPARIRLELIDPDVAAAWLEAGEAECEGDRVFLTAGWESSKRNALSYVRVWTRAVAEVLREAGVEVRADLRMSDALDVDSVRRGLILVDHLGCISVEDILATRKVYVSRVPPGPFVLEVVPTQVERGAAWLAGVGRPVIEEGQARRVNLGQDPSRAIEHIVEALRALEDSPTSTLVARYAPLEALPWP